MQKIKIKITNHLPSINFGHQILDDDYDNYETKRSQLLTKPCRYRLETIH